MRGDELGDFLDNLVARVADYVDQSHNEGQKTVDYLPASSRKKTTDLSLPLEGHGTEAVLDLSLIHI